jgi:hypothetical protein
MEKVLTGEFRVSYPSLFVPTSMQENQEKKYSIVMLIPKTDKKTLEALEKLVIAAGREKWKDFDTLLKQVKPDGSKVLRLPFKDGDLKKEVAGYEGHWYMSATSKQKPGLVDQNVQPIISQEGFYAGCYARAEVTAYAYDKAGNKGIAFGLQHVQKMRDGDPFTGRSKPEDVFSAVGGDNPADYQASNASLMG